MSATQIMIVEDDLITAQALKSRIENNPQFEICSMQPTFADAMKVLSEKLPQVLLVDLHLPDGDGIDIIKSVAEKDPNLPIMVISLFGDEQHVIQAIQAGAQGYMLKESNTEQINQSINELLKGGSPISPSIARHLIKRFHAPNKASATENTLAQENTPQKEILSERELEVLQLASKGFTYTETAKLLNLSVNTISSYTKRIYGKLAVNSKIEAIFEATKQGIM